MDLINAQSQRIDKLVVNVKELNDERLLHERLKYTVEFAKWAVDCREPSGVSGWERRAQNISRQRLRNKGIPVSYKETLFRHLDQIVPIRNYIAHGPPSRFAYLLEEFGSEEEQEYWGVLFEVKEKQPLSALAHTYRAVKLPALYVVLRPNPIAIEMGVHGDKIIYKVLNAENDPIHQGYKEGEYDLVVAFFVIYATSKLDVALSNLRKLLRPGGMLVVGEGGHNNLSSASSGFIFGTLLGWWYGVDEGRTLSPLVTTEEWDKLLKNIGFSGVDSASPPEFTDVFTNLFVSQAVDDKVRFLREPLSSPSNAPIESLIIVGGKTARGARIVEGLKPTLGGLAQEMVSLVELDAPVFKDITQAEFSSLKKMFEEGKTMLWLTSGRQDDVPWSNMTVGFGRTAMHENSELRLQHLDVLDPELLDPKIVAETLLRFQAKIQDSILWTEEPEVILDSNGRQSVPRFRPIPSLYDRYNSIRRSIMHEVDIRKSAVTIEFGYGGCVIKEISKYEITDNPTSLMEIRIMYAVLSALKTALGHKFLVLGKESSTGDSYLTLVLTLAFIPKVLTLVGHNLSPLIAQAITAQAFTKDVGLVYTTDSNDPTAPSSWIRLTPYISQSELKIREQIHHPIKPSAGLPQQDLEEFIFLCWF
ncbi:hypothetical protein B7463_g10614, partial [Scytalidium lignicola]